MESGHGIFHFTTSFEARLTGARQRADDGASYVDRAAEVGTPRYPAMPVELQLLGPPVSHAPSDCGSVRPSVFFGRMLGAKEGEEGLM